MQLLREPEQARRWVEQARWRTVHGGTSSRAASSNSVGIIPTMGALHEGHLSLVHEASQRCDQCVATIFVNPTQFGPGEDLQRYPRTLDEDLRQLEAAGVSAVFVPAVEAIYPEGFSTYVEPPQIAELWEGQCRPGHFRGVCTVVLKLFSLLPATHAFFGRKDYQQWRVIEAMVRDLSLGIEVIPCATVRESDGLAMSSRNRYLDSQQRARALSLWRTLEATRLAVAAGATDVAALEFEMRQRLMGEDSSAKVDTSSEAVVDRIDYAAIVDARTLCPLRRIDRDAVALVAAWVGTTRLIDNVDLIPGSSMG